MGVSGWNVCAVAQGSLCYTGDTVAVTALLPTCGMQVQQAEIHRRCRQLGSAQVFPHRPMR